jgi:hypothetical protein
VEQPALVHECFVKPLALRPPERAWELETLDSDRLIEANVMPAVDDAKTPLADHGVDTNLALERRAHPAKGI